MKIELILDTRQKDKVKSEYPVKVKLTGNNQRVYISTGFSVEERQFKNGQVTKHGNSVQINQAIGAILDKYNNAYLKNSALSPLELRKEVESNKGNISLIDYFEQWIKDGERQATITYQSAKSFRSSLERLRKFNPGLTFEEIGVRFYESYMEQMTSEGLKQNTIAKEIKVVKSIMNKALDKGLTENNQHQRDYFKAKKEETDAVYLSSSEIEKLLNAEMPTPALEVQRDRFVLNCCLGVRISDLRRIERKHLIEIEGKKFIRLNTQKTKTDVVIPVNSMAEKILNKYDYHVPVVSSQKANEYNKDVCMHAEIDYPVEHNGKTLPKYKLITNHTARRSFATNGYLAGVNPLILMKITGHKQFKTFLQYIRASSLEAAIASADHPFFK